MPIVKAAFTELLDEVWPVQYYMPASRWQDWKLRWAPRWFLQYFPVRFVPAPGEYEPLTQD